MPSSFARRRPPPSIRAVARQQHIQVPIRPPWLGYIPDIYGDVVGLSAAADCSGLITEGMRIRVSDGFTAVQPSDLPLGEDVGGAAAAPATSGREQRVAGLGFFPEIPGTNEKVFAITEKNANTAEGRFWIIDTSAWTAEAKEGMDAMLTAGLYDWTVFPGGTPAGKTTNGEVETSVLIFTNNGDHVWKYPATTGSGTYDRLNADGGGFGASFKAQSCESFFNRVVYLNTEEGGTRYVQRFRWSPIGTADPEPVPASADPGGAVDLYVFEQEGLRCLAMGNLVALYFKDGVAFAHPIQDIALNVIRPFSIEVVSQTRGPISSQSVVQIGQNRHFLLCNDGWWILDSAGDWFEAGRLTLGADSTRFRRGQSLTKWKSEFYSNLNRDQVEKITVAYDAFRNHVLIAWPSTSSPENNKLWRYDVLTDSVWPDDFTQLGDGAPETNLTPTYLASVNRSVVSADTWATVLGLEVHKFTFSNGTTLAGGTVTFTLDGTDVEVELANGISATDCATEVVSNAYTVAFEATGWLAVYSDGPNVFFYATTPGDKTPTLSFVDTDTTGAAGSFALEREGDSSQNAWLNQTGSWFSAAPEFGDVIPWHGTQLGQIFFHDFSLITKAGNEPTWYWRSHESNWGLMGSYKTLDRLMAEIRKSQTTQQISFEVFSEGLSKVSSATVQLSDNTMVSAFEDVFAYFKHTGVHLGYGVSGSGFVNIAEIVAWIHAGPEIRGA